MAYDESYRGGDWSDRGSWGGQNSPGWRGGGEYYGGYGAGAPGWRGQEMLGADRYMSDYYDNRLGSAYDRGYKSRWQTDYGDPFGDRHFRPPMRSRSPYDRGWYGEPRASYPMGYRPYSARGGYDTNFRTYRSYGRGYDRGWY